MSDNKKKLTRSKDDRWLAGVCGGLGDYFGIDGTLVRVLFILFGFAVGGGIIIYIILWIIMPEASDVDEDILEGEVVEELKDAEVPVEEEPVEESEPTDEEEA